MALESASYIAGLDVNNPLGSDPKSQGDDHIRMIKSVLKNTFPNLAGAVTLNQNELNNASNPFPSQAGQSGKVLKTDGTNVHWELETQELPSQVGQAGKALVTDGSNAYWVMLVPVQNGNAGKVLKTNGNTTYWDSLPVLGDILPNQAGNAGKVLKTDGTNASWKQTIYINTDFPNVKNDVSGWQKLPNGMIIQWGWVDNLTFNQAATTNSVLFPVPFVNGVMFPVTQIIGDTSGELYAKTVSADNLSKNGMDLICWQESGVSVYGVRWFVIGF